eukprot:scaffold8013_cov187-Ochromonas_danica.AAC.3
MRGEKNKFTDDCFEMKFNLGTEDMEKKIEKLLLGSSSSVGGCCAVVTSLPLCLGLTERKN